MPSYSYSYWNNFFESDYNIEEDLTDIPSQIYNKISYSGYNPMHIIKTIPYTKLNLSDMSGLTTKILINPLLLGLIGGYYYYQLNQDNKAQQTTIQELHEQIDALQAQVDAGTKLSNNTDDDQSDNQ